MPPALLEFHKVSFCHSTSASPLFEGLSASFGRGWTGVVGPNGAGKTTLLQLACGMLPPTAGTVQRPARVGYCAQATEAPPPGLAEFLATADSAACALRGRLEIQAGWLARWTTLSEGERKRTQIGVALAAAPALLALDEPTNHIDAATRSLLVGVLRRFRGIGLLVSHDRELLDALCGSCLLLDRRRATLRPGGYSQARALAEHDEAELRRRRAAARSALQRLEAEAGARRHEAAQADRRRSKRGLDRHDHSAKGAIDLARVSGKDGAAGRKLRQLQGRIAHAAAELDAMEAPRPQRMGIGIGGARARRPLLGQLPAGALLLGDGRRLAWPVLDVTNDARIALTGRNGAGKSTLVRHLLAQLDVPAAQVVVLPQELTAAEARGSAESLRSLAPAERGVALSHISRLGSSPVAVLETVAPSPGEARKILVALGLARQPELIVMDEPTNHLDLPSIECLEAALEEFAGALLLVSHDQRFLGRLTRTRWEIADGWVNVRHESGLR